MEWQLALLLILGGLIFMMLTGLPLAFCFILVNLVAAFFFWGGGVGVEQHIIRMVGSLTIFALLPVPLFILMGEVMFHSGIAPLLIDAIDRWLGRLPGRLGLLAVGAGTIFSTLTGTSLASIAMLGTVLVPEMEKRGYKKSMSLGPILGSGGLAMMIPPSALAVLLGAIGIISVHKILIAIIVPGLLMALFYSSYIILRCWLQPSIAPSYDVPHIPLSEKLIATVRYVLPLGFIIFMVIGVMILGVATPSEAAATGALATFILAAFYRRLDWDMVKKSVGGTFRITVMLFMIIAGATAFAQNLAYTGATRGFIDMAIGLPVSPIVVIIIMQLVLLVLGTFMDVVGIMMVTLPIYVPVVTALGFDLVWFAAIMLLNIEMAITTPPYGTGLFTMKGVAPAGTTMGDIYKAGLPFLGCDAIVMALMLVFPAIVLWLPGLMR